MSACLCVCGACVCVRLTYVDVAGALEERRRGPRHVSRGAHLDVGVGEQVPRQDLTVHTAGERNIPIGCAQRQVLPNLKGFSAFSDVNSNFFDDVK